MADTPSSSGEQWRPLLEPDAELRRLPKAALAAIAGHALVLLIFVTLQVVVRPPAPEAPPQEAIEVMLVERPEPTPAAPAASEAAAPGETPTDVAAARLDVQTSVRAAAAQVVLSSPDSTSRFNALPEPVRDAVAAAQCDPYDLLRDESDIACPLSSDRRAETSGLEADTFLEAALAPGDGPPRLNAGPVAFGLTLGQEPTENASGAAAASGSAAPFAAMNSDATTIGLVAEVEVGRGTLSFIAGQRSGLAGNEAMGLAGNENYVGVRYRLRF